MRQAVRALYQHAIVLILIGVVVHDRVQAGREPQTDQIIKARGLLLLDKAGLARIKVGVGQSPSEPASLILCDKAGNDRLAIGITASGEPVITLDGPEGHHRMVLIATDKEGSVFSVSAPSGDSLYQLSSESDGSMREVFFDKKGRARVKTRVETDGRVERVILGPADLPVELTGVFADGQVIHNYYDRRGKPRLSLGVNDAGASQVRLRDELGREHAGIVLLPDGTVRQTLSDSSGTPRVGMTVNSRGEPRIGLAYPSAKNAIDLYVENQGNTSIILGDPAGKKSIGIKVDINGVPSFIVPE